MKRFVITLGNVELRPGHRHDCAQVELNVSVRADDKAGALDRLRELAAEGPLDLTGNAPWPMTVTINPDTLGARSVRVTELP